MKNLKIFPKMFLQTFGILGTVIVLIHLLVFFIFPRTYLETRKQELYSKADEISKITFFLLHSDKKENNKPAP